MSGAKAVWALTLANEKSRKLRKIMKARTRGMVVICDRWPQMQFPGELDGPRLTHWGDGQRAAATARRLRTAAVRVGAPVSARHRDPTRCRRGHRGGPASRGRPRRTSRTASIWCARLNFDGSLFGAVDIDGTQPPDKVLTAILRAIWSRL